MTTKRETLSFLRKQGVIEAIRWAYTSAVARTLDDYSEAAGHDGAWLGTTRYILTRNRLDRVFHCGQFRLPEGSDPSSGLDLLHEQLTTYDIRSMPNLAPELVRREDLNASPGWAVGSYRFLLASAEFGKIDSVPWSQKSPTKQQVAMQDDPEPPPTLFDEIEPDEAARLQATSPANRALDFETLVVAHSLDPISNDVELVVGRPRMSASGEDSWYWYKDIWGQQPTLGGPRRELPQPPAPDGVPDVQVRIRPRHATERSDGAK